MRYVVPHNERFAAIINQSFGLERFQDMLENV
jgi:hypothetical protein